MIGRGGCPGTAVGPLLPAGSPDRMLRRSASWRPAAMATPYACGGPPNANQHSAPSPLGGLARGETEIQRGLISGFSGWVLTRESRTPAPGWKKLMVAGAEGDK